MHASEGASAPPLLTPQAGLALWRGSPRLALQTYLSPVGEKKGPLWAHLGLMVGSNTLIAALITLASLPGSLPQASEMFIMIFPFAQFIGCSIIVLHTLGQALVGEERIRAWPLAMHLGYRFGIAILGVFMGYTIGLSWRIGRFQTGFAAFQDERFMASIGIALVATFVFFQIVTAQARAARAQAETERERARSAAAEAREAAARLQLLQAQIEPHFLFNTLANVLGLIESRPRDAKQMLEDFIFYLRASLNVTRGTSTQLGAELDLLSRYLSIFQFRMGRRLAFAIECPAELREIPIAPMLLQPLVENCIEHGLEPKVDGGRIDVSVRRALGTLHIAIADTGLGFFPSDSAGVGLANVRERLQLLYGERARLTVEEQRPEGTLVRIAIADSAPQADTQAAADPPRTQPAGAGPEVPTGPVHAGLLKPGARA